MYAWVVMTATVMRKKLFQVLDRALQGETIEIVYKGSKVRVTAPSDGSKLARAVRRHALLVDPQSIVESDSALMADLERQWKQDDKAL
jgi:antitoxin (DNA-binding transcriptional repressor) of toxin-antitoxin stability system